MFNMEEHVISGDKISTFSRYLQGERREPETIEKYIWDVRAFAAWLSGWGGCRPRCSPHNLRYLFARIFYRACQDVSQLADVLGHSSIETIRIYLISSGTKHARRLEPSRHIRMRGISG